MSMPLVNIEGDGYRSSLSTQAVRLKASPVQACNETDMSVSVFKSHYSPVYRWEIFNTNDLLIPTFSVIVENRFSSTITVAPYTLLSNNKYNIVVTLSLTHDGITHYSIHTCYLMILTSPLKAVLFPLGHATVLHGESLTLNASQSYDSDVALHNLQATPSLIYKKF